MSRFCRVGRLRDSDDLKFKCLYGECSLYRQLEGIYSRCLAACSRAHRGEYGVQAYEAKRCNERRRNERYEASQAIRRTDHVDERIASLKALLGEIAAELGVTGEVALEPMIIESAARTGLDGRLHSGSRAPRSWHLDEPIVDLTRGNALLVATTVSNAQGEEVTTLNELVEVMMSKGILTEPLYLSGQLTDITTQRSHPRLRTLATVSTVMEGIVTVQSAVGSEWLGLEPED